MRRWLRAVLHVGRHRLDAHPDAADPPVGTVFAWGTHLAFPPDGVAITSPAFWVQEPGGHTERRWLR